MKRKPGRKRLETKGKREFQRVERNRMSYALICLLIAAAFLTVRCGEGPILSSSAPKAKTAGAEKKITEPTKVEQKQESERSGPKDYAYDPTGKVDPFKPFLQPTSSKRSGRNVPLTPLEKYEISQLKLVAIISTPEGNIALIEDSTGKGYFLRKGTGVGKNEGRVKMILKDKVVIEETFQDILGQTKNNEVSLYLHRIEEGGES